MLATACLLPILNGCQSYVRQPLDHAATRSAWLARSPQDQTVREFAATLQADQGDATAQGPTRFDPTDGLSLAEAEVVALVWNPGLRLARLEANVARADAAHAGLWQDPVLGIDLERILSNADGANPWVAGSTVGLTIPISGRLEAERALANAGLAATLDRLAALEWATRSALRELWIEWSAASLHAELTEALIARLHHVASLADLQEQAGSISRVEARLFDVELAAHEADMIAISARQSALELQLRSMLGLAPGTPLTLMPSITFAPRTTSMDELMRSLDTSNPELKAIRAEYESAENALRMEVRKQYPDLTIGPGYGSDQGDNRALLGVSLPIPLWNRNRQGVAQASAMREVAKGRFETRYEQLASALELARTRIESERTRRELIESRVVPLADAQEADLRRTAELGRVDPLLLLESFKSQHAAKNRLVEARAAESIGAVRLDELLGPPLPEPAPPAIPDSQSTSPRNAADEH